MKQNPLNQNPYDYECVICGEVADELYEDDWMCEDCIVGRMEHDDS